MSLKSFFNDARLSLLSGVAAVSTIFVMGAAVTAHQTNKELENAFESKRVEVGGKVHSVTPTTVAVGNRVEGYILHAGAQQELCDVREQPHIPLLTSAYNLHCAPLAEITPQDPRYPIAADAITAYATATAHMDSKNVLDSQQRISAFNQQLTTIPKLTDRLNVAQTNLLAYQPY